MENLTTLADPDQFELLLKETNYDVKKTEFVVDGFMNGFSRISNRHS